jgi:hypothetical protein
VGLICRQSSHCLWQRVSKPVLSNIFGLLLLAICCAETRFCTEARPELRGFWTDMMAGFAVVNGNLQRIGRMPVHLAAASNQQADQNQAPAQQNPATLSKKPKTLCVLWPEQHMEGTGSRKAARLFAAQERGQVKCNCHGKRQQLGRQQQQ